MKPRSLSLLVAACFALPVPAAAQAVTRAPLSTGEVTFAMRATKVNDFIGHAPIARAEFTGDQLSRVAGFAEVRVADMSTGIGLRDRHMRNAMKADSFPVIRFDLASVEPGTAIGDSIPVTLNGRLTIHGVTRPVRISGSVLTRGGHVELMASFPVDMRQYGIDPPTRFFGAIRVDPVTTVGVSLRF